MSPANECIPFYEPGSRITGHAEAAIVGKRFVMVSDPIQAGPELNTSVSGGNIVVSHAAAAGLAIGVSSHDAAIGTKVTILGPGFIVPVTAAEAITAGEEVEVATGGKAAVLAAGISVGIALDSADTDTDVMVQVRNGRGPTGPQGIPG